jgi:NADH-quinone oxidoreductase subunit L
MPIYILGLPLISGIICGLGSKFLSHRIASFIASSMLVISAILSIQVLFEVQLHHKIFHIIIAKWFSITGNDINWAIYVDQLTAVMFTVVTIVSSVVHIYSYGYMQDDENLPRFMSYLSFFTFCMLVLVSADNFLQLFFGWEGVGLCSYLLIGFWYKKDSASKAAVKAFIVNRVGDFAFILGIILIMSSANSINFDEVFNSKYILPVFNTNGYSHYYEFIAGIKVLKIEIICMLLFIGCMGKSAQIGLHVWLPDAMEGPTPVSALIHAATMVTAGVFLLARCQPLFIHAPIVSDIILWVGSITCIFAASIAVAQTDIKKIIAYSTCSQLGYMFMACGALSYESGIFHLVTHAFFKAMLFLCAGVVIHAVHEQDITKMGGLRKYMPVTYILFWIGSLAIMGIYPFAGFYSKDLILESVFMAPNGQLPFIIGLCSAFLTAVYSMKIIVMVFHGNSQNDHHAHEGPLVMVLPLLLLAVGSVCSGWFLVSYFSIHEHNEAVEQIKYLPMAVGLSGMIFGFIIYQWKIAAKLARTFRFLHQILANKYFIDEIYDIVFIRTTFMLSRVSKSIDAAIDFVPNSSADISQIFAGIISRLQSGYIFSYVFYILLGLLGVMFWWIVRWLI